MASEASSGFGRRSTLLVLFTAECGVCAGIWYATTVQYATFHVSIGKATITMDSTYKIVGISGGPIAGPINGIRNQLYDAHKAAFAALLAGTVLHTVTQTTEWYRRKNSAEPGKTRDGGCAQFISFIYFLCWLCAFIVCGAGAVIWYCDYADRKISVASFEAKDGVKATTYCTVALSVVGLWRLIAWRMRPSRRRSNEPNIAALYNV